MYIYIYIYICGSSGALVFAGGGRDAFTGLKRINHIDINDNESNNDNHNNNDTNHNNNEYHKQ